MFLTLFQRVKRAESPNQTRFTFRNVLIQNLVRFFSLIPVVSILISHITLCWHLIVPMALMMYTSMMFILFCCRVVLKFGRMWCWLLACCTVSDYFWVCWEYSDLYIFQILYLQKYYWFYIDRRGGNIIIWKLAICNVSAILKTSVTEIFIL